MMIPTKRDKEYVSNIPNFFFNYRKKLLNFLIYNNVPAIFSFNILRNYKNFIIIS